MAFDPLSIGLQVGGKLIDHFFPDPAKKAEAQLELLKLAQEGDLTVAAQQSDVNKAEAATGSLFIAGWRPFVGWTCGLGLGVQFVFGPIAEWISSLAGHPVKVPTLETGTITTLLIGMLGLGGMRTLEKLQGAEGNR